MSGRGREGGKRGRRGRGRGGGPHHSNSSSSSGVPGGGAVPIILTKPRAREPVRPRELYDHTAQPAAAAQPQPQIQIQQQPHAHHQQDQQPASAPPPASSSSSPPQRRLLHKERDLPEQQQQHAGSEATTPAAATAATPVARAPQKVLAAATTAQEPLQCPIRLIDERFQWIDRTRGLFSTSNHPFLVVGTFGLQGLGKSTLLNLLNGDPDKAGAFKEQTLETLCAGKHHTRGVDVSIDPQRTILLDTQPVLSLSVMDHMMRNEFKLPGGLSEPEQAMLLQSLQLAVFLMTTCHVVLVPMPWSFDRMFGHFLRSLDTLCTAFQNANSPEPTATSSSSSSSSSSGVRSQHRAQLLFVINKAPRQSFSESSLLRYEALLEAFVPQEPSLVVAGAPHPGTASVLGQSSSDKDKEHPTHTASNSGTGVSKKQARPRVVVVPDRDDDIEQGSSFVGRPSFHQCAERLKARVLGTPQTPIFHTHSSKPMTELDWWAQSNKTWSSVLKSSVFFEFVTMCQRQGLF